MRFNILCQFVWSVLCFPSFRFVSFFFSLPTTVSDAGGNEGKKEKATIPKEKEQGREKRIKQIKRNETKRTPHTTPHAQYHPFLMSGIEAVAHALAGSSGGEWDGQWGWGGWIDDVDTPRRHADREGSDREQLGGKERIATQTAHVLKYDVSIPSIQASLR